MIVSDNSSIAGLLRRVTVGEKEQRLQACSEFQQALASVHDIKALGRDPFVVLRALEEQFFNRLSFEFKKEVAKCIGTLGYAMGNKINDYIVWLFESYEKCTGDDLKSLYMEALSATYKCDISIRKLRDMVPANMSELQKILETSKYADLLIPVVEVILCISTIYPDVFSPHFKDIIDILMGWYIDPEQSEKFLDQLDRSLSKLQTYWLSDMDFTSVLMSQFLEDAENDLKEILATEVHGNRAHIESLKTTVVKVSYLIRAFKLLLDVISEYFVVNPEDARVKSFISESFTKLTFCVECCLKTNLLKFDSIIVQVLFASKTILYIYRMHTYLLLEPIFKVCNLISAIGNLTTKSLLRFVNLIKKIILYTPADYLSDYIADLLSPDKGILFKLRNHTDNQVFASVLEMYKTLLLPKNVKCLQSVYSLIISELRYCIVVMFKTSACTLSDDADCLIEWEGVDLKPWLKLDYLAEYAESTLIYLSCSFHELASAKNSLIGMWALSPNLFSLLTTYLPTTSNWFIVSHPSAAYSVIYTLKLYCECHDHFICNSDILQTLTPNLMYSNQTGKHFGVILEILTNIFSNNKCGYDIIALCLQWLMSLLESTQKVNNALVFKNQRFKQTLLAFCGMPTETILAVSPDYQACCRRLLKYVKPYFDEELTERFCERFTLMVFETADKVWLFEVIKFGIDLRPLFGESLAAHDIGPVALIESQKAFLASLCQESNFNDSQFKRIMNFLLLDSGLKEENSSDQLWKDELLLAFHSSRVISNKAEYDKFHTVYFLWYWAAWESAQFCVNSRLKTPFGKPQDTFLNIEAVIKEMAHCDPAMKPEREFDEDYRQTNGTALNRRRFVDWHRIRWLLHFIDFLDKQMYNAYEGFAFAMPSPQKSVKAFFRTNKSTCLEWLNRIRLALMEVASKNGLHSFVLRLSWQSFFDFEHGGSKNPENVEQIVLLTARAFLALKDEYGLIGLMRKSKKLFGAKNEWISACAEQAAERYENAIDQYKAHLDEFAKNAKSDAAENASRSKENLLSGSAVIDFCNEQIIRCFNKLCDWTSALEYFENSQLPSALSKSLAPDCTKKYAQLMLDLTRFDKLTETLDVSKSVRKTFQAVVDDRLMSWQEDVFSRHFEKSFCELLADSMENSSDNENLQKYFCSDLNYAQRLHICANYPAKLNSNLEGSRLLVDSLFVTKHFPISVNFNKMVSLHNRKNASFDLTTKLYHFATCRRKMACMTEAADDHDLCVLASYLSRKRNNLQLASRQISAHYRIPYNNWDLNSMNRAFCNSSSVEPISVDRFFSAIHTAKLFFRMDKRTDAFGLLTNLAAEFLDKTFGPTLNALAASQQHEQRPNFSYSTTVAQLFYALASKANGIIEPGRGWSSPSSIWSHGSNISDPKNSYAVNFNKCLLLLAHWLPTDSSFGAQILSINEDSLLIKLLEEQMEAVHTSLDVGGAERVVGAVLTLARKFSPSCVKSQIRFADWAYNTANNTLEYKNSIPHIRISEEYSQLLTKWMPQNIDIEKRNSLEDLITSLRHFEDGKIVDDVQLKFEIGKLINDDSFDPEPLITIWKRLNAEIIRFYDASVQTYFQYLNFNAKTSTDTIKASLRLLQLLSSHCEDLSSTFDSGLHLVRSVHWNTIVPQLFARLRHGHVRVRRALRDILCNVARLNPELVIFPATVGCLDAAILSPSAAAPPSADSLDESSESIAAQSADVKKSIDDDVVDESSCCVAIASALGEKHGRLSVDARSFVRELQRVAMLRDEVWLVALTYAQQEVVKRLRSLSKKTSAKEGSAAEAIALRDLIVVSMSDLHKLTSVDSETENDVWFLKHVNPVIEEALAAAKSHTDPELAWEPFNNLLNSLTARANRKSNWQVATNCISPVLASMKSTQIPMPGVMPINGQIVYIEAVGPETLILPTKTRPRKLNFIGSDGKTYCYLSKGSEDLRLDERIMQLLSTCNVIFQDKKKSQHFVARNYSVIPLGPRCGLIQWVENATPLYTVYKRWLTREATVSGKSCVPRPSEIFYTKLEHVLLNRNIKDLENRHKWPVSAMKETLNELIAETPRDLLAREIWCLSINSDLWRRSVEKFAASTAVMSIIGYIVGLGDRHLDNILVDFESGNVVHIDYNVCFEKGKHLRVPETVPFRLTPNIQAALGVSGTEGSFRVSCEKVLEILRQNHEIILLLLQAFLYDPLLDWTLKKGPGFQWLNHKISDALALYGSDGTLKSDYSNEDTKKPLVKMEKNVHALNVLKRVKYKLEGCVTDPGKFLTVSEQADFVIREAASLENLCLLYEGWTAWV